MKENLQCSGNRLYKSGDENEIKKTNSKTKIIKFLPLLLLIIFPWFYLTNCSKSEIKNESNGITFKNLLLNASFEEEALVKMGHISGDTAVFTIQPGRILQGVYNDSIYRLLFDESTKFEFLEESINLSYRSTENIYLSIKGKAFEFGKPHDILVLFHLQPAETGDVYNVYTKVHLCKSSGCQSCSEEYDGTIVIGCTCGHSNGSCEHNIAVKDKGEYFILPIK
jgi:hypothetical protein